MTSRSTHTIQEEKGRPLPTSSQTPEREIERLRIERDEVAAAAKRVAACLQQFMDDTTDPGTEALAAQYELNRILSLLTIDETVIGEAQYLSRFSATPSEINSFLANRLPEDVHLNYQQAIGEEAVREAAEDLRAYRHHPDADLMKQAWRTGVDDAIDQIDPDRAGPFPSKLIRLGEEPFPPRGGHDTTCAYVSGMTTRCTCSTEGGAA